MVSGYPTTTNIPQVDGLSTDPREMGRHMFAKPVFTPLVVGTSLTAKDGTTLVNATMYRQVVGEIVQLWLLLPNCNG